MNTGLTNLNVGGLAISPNYETDQTIFAGMFSGGVFKSTDGGVSWTASNPGMTRYYALAISPNYAVDQTIFAGNDYGAIMKSTNGGTTWISLNVGIPGTLIKGLAISPNYASDHTIFAATDGKGVYKSTNGGSTWTAVNGGFTYLMIHAIAISPNFIADQTLYAASPGGVFKTTNGGASWSVVNTGLTYFSYTSLAISPSYAADQTVFVATIRGIFRTTNGGTGWSAVNTGVLDRSIRSLVISPDYVSDHILFAGSKGGGINKSIDGGTTWAQANAGLTNLEVKSIAVSPDYASGGTLFAGTYGGENLYKSTDQGSSWSGVTMNLPATDTVQAIALSSDYAADATLFAGTISFGVYKSTNGGGTWNTANSGLGSGSSYVYSLALSPNYANDHTLFAGTLSGVFKSTDGGTSWSAANSGLPYFGVNAVALSPDFALDHEVYAGMSSGAVSKSTNGGATWTTVLMGPNVYALALSPAYTTDHTIYAGAYDGVYKSLDSGGTWSRTTMGSGGNMGNISSLVLSPGYETDQTVFVGWTYGGVYKSTNGGASWSAMNSGLANLAIQALATSPAYAVDQTIYAGTKSTVSSYRNTYPTTEATAPGYPFNTWTSSASVDVTLTARDHSGSGIAAGYPKVCTDSTNSCTPSASYQGPVSVTCPASSACVQYVRYRSADSAGNVESEESVKVMQDLSAPLTTATPVGGTYTTPPSVTLECNDLGSGCAATYYTIDGSEPTTRYTGPITISGATTLKFKSVDTVGNPEPVIRSEAYSLVAASATLTASPLRVQLIGSSVAFTAAGQGGTGAYEFEFWERKNDTTSWTKVQVYSGSNAWIWDTTGFEPGSYYVKVHVRCAGSTAAYEAYRSILYSLVEAPPVTGVTLMAGPTSPQMVGLPIGFTAVGQGGTGDYEYKYLLKSSATTTWTIVKDYSSVNTWSWDTGQFAAGTYSVMVYARTAGSLALYEAARSIAFSIAEVSPATSVVLQSDIASPAQRQMVQFTAAAQGGTGSYEYKFLVKGATGAWIVIRDYMPDSICLWDAGLSGYWPAGKYTIQVMARSAGSGTEYDVLKNVDFIISDTMPATGVSLVANPSSPAQRSTIWFTATAQGGFGAYEYKFLVKNATGAWTVMRDYQWDGNWLWEAWDMNQWPAGKYTIQVMARSVGSGTEYDVLKNMDFIISDTMPATGVSLVANPSSPAQRSTIWFTAAAQGGFGPAYEYKFLVKNATGAWTVMRDYQWDGNWLWEAWDMNQWPAGKYTIQVMARSVGSGTEYDVLKNVDFIISNTMPATAVSLSADKASPAQRSTIWFTAAAQGGFGPAYEYKFLVKNATGAWTLGRDYQPDGNWWWEAWDMNQWPAGKYTIQVMARSMGSGTEYDAFKNVDFTIVDDDPVSAVSLVITNGKKSPAVLDTVGTVQFQAAATGSTGDYEYEYRVKNIAGTVWTILKEYNALDTINWTPTQVGSYTIQVRARNVGSVAAYEAYRNITFSVVTDDPVTSVSLTSDKTSPKTLSAAGTITFEALATGTMNNYEYQFLVKSSVTGLWTTPREWSDIRTFPWTPEEAGTYTIQVRARNVGSAASYEAYRNRTFIITQ